MNELNTRLLEYLPDPNTVKGGIGGVVEMLQEEAPLLVQDVLTWNSMISLVWFWMWVAAAAISIVLFIMSIAATYKNEDYIPTCFISFFSLLGSAIFACMNLQWWQIAIAPRLFLIEYISNLM